MTLVRPYDTTADTCAYTTDAATVYDMARDGYELLWNVINYITNYMLKIVFWLHY